MDIKNLKDFPDGKVFETDILIIGGGAAGLSIAREFFDTSWSVVVAESGDVEQTDEHELLNEVELESDALPDIWQKRRNEYHGHQTQKWSENVQRFGIRCRGLGGSTAAWAGKSAPFVPFDYAHRPWLPYSGWPIDETDIEPYVRRAEQKLNLGLGAYGPKFWERYKGKYKKLNFDPDVLSSFFWQFARSRINPVDIMRMGPEFMRENQSNVRVLVNATAIAVTPLRKENSVLVNLAGLGAGTAKVKAKKVIVSCGAIENARLLLASKTVNPTGLGNDNDQVGRYLMDHLHAPVVKFDEADVKTITEQFGFFGLEHNQRVDMYSHGLGLGADIQEREKLVNAGMFCVAEKSPDDPWGALGRLLRGRSKSIFKDIFSVVKGPRMMISGVGRIFLQSARVPALLKNFIINTFMKLMPNFVVEEYQSQGIPHKLISCSFDAVVEQEPQPHNRVILSTNVDMLGQPLPLVRWEPGEKSLVTLKRAGEHLVEQFKKAGLPVPETADWIKTGDDVPIIDMAHTSGTTRMSDNPKTGVVDANCKVHTCQGVYIAGGSVLPTCSHTNPTLQIVSIAIRLADHLKEQLEQVG